MNWFLQALSQYATFSGRARRKEYWFFMLFYVLFYLVAAFLDDMASAGAKDDGPGIVAGMFSLALLLPSIAVGVRRLHDIGRSGWWLLLSIIPVIGTVWLLVLNVRDSEPGPNAWGPNPKEVS